MNTAPQSQPESVEDLRRQLAEITTANRYNLNVIKELIFAAGGEIVVTDAMRLECRDYEWYATHDGSPPIRTTFRAVTREEFAKGLVPPKMS